MTDLRSLLGPLGIWGHLASLPAAELRPFVARAAELGYGALWVGDGCCPRPLRAAGSCGRGLGLDGPRDQHRQHLRARRRWPRSMGAMTLHELTAGRFALGLGVSHVHLVAEAARPRLREAADAHARVPRCLRPAALSRPGHRRARTASPPSHRCSSPRCGRACSSWPRPRTDGALPFLVTAERIAWMREVLDAGSPGRPPRPVLATALAAVVEADPELARAAARAWMQPYCRAENYQGSLAEQGFGPGDWEPPYSDRLVDALVAWGVHRRRARTYRRLPRRRCRPCRGHPARGRWRARAPARCWRRWLPAS